MVRRHPPGAHSGIGPVSLLPSRSSSRRCLRGQSSAKGTGPVSPRSAESRKRVVRSSRMEIEVLHEGERGCYRSFKCSNNKEDRAMKLECGVAVVVFP